MNNINKYLPGFVISGLITLAAFLLAKTDIAQQIHLSALTIAILIGIAFGNLFYGKIEHAAAQGITFIKGTVLRLGIVLYGFNISLNEISAVGINAILADGLMLVMTFFITCALGIYLFNIDKQIVYLTASGCSICGAAAIMATESVVKGGSHKVSIAVALIVIFGTLCMFLYPLVYPYVNHILTAHQFGIYIGSSVHEVAQVYAAGGAINPTTADTAVITKMIRVMMLAPFLIFLSWYLTKNDPANQSKKLHIPWFAVLFIGTAVFNSFGLLPESVVNWLIELDRVLLMLAMSALGVTTQISAIKQAGVKPLLLGFTVCIWLIVGGFLINLGLQTALR